LVAKFPWFWFHQQEDKPPTDEEHEQEQALKASFRNIAGEDMEIDAYELKGILNQVFKKGGADRLNNE